MLGSHDSHDPDQSTRLKPEQDRSQDPTLDENKGVEPQVANQIGCAKLSGHGSTRVRKRESHQDRTHFESKRVDQRQLKQSRDPMSGESDHLVQPQPRRIEKYKLFVRTRKNKLRQDLPPGENEYLGQPKLKQLNLDKWLRCYRNERLGNDASR